MVIIPYNFGITGLIQSLKKRNTRRDISLLLQVGGARELRDLTFLGYLYGAVTDFTCCCSSLVSWLESWDRNCGARTTNAFTTCNKDEGQERRHWSTVVSWNNAEAGLRFPTQHPLYIRSNVPLDTWVREREKVGITMAKFPALSQVLAGWAGRTVN